MLKMLEGGEKYEDVYEATVLALELAKWWTPEKTVEEGYAFLQTKTDNLDIMRKAIVIWLASISSESKNETPVADTNAGNKC